MHGLLHIGIKVLHPKTQAVKAHIAQIAQALSADGARVNFNRVFTIGRKLKVRPQALPPIGQLRIAKKCRRAAAHMQLTD